MRAKIDKLEDLDYNELIALAVIEKDIDLKEIFTDEVKLSFNLVLSLSKEDNLTPEIKSFIKEIFDQVITSKPNLIEWYLKLSSTTEVINVETVNEALVKESKPKKRTSVLPRRYGKANILLDIEKQGGKPTNAQLTALAINELKNIWVNLNNRLINDMLGDSKKLTDEDYRDLRATITIVKNKTKSILAKK